MSNNRILTFFALSGIILLIFIFKRNAINLDIKEIGDFTNIFTSIVLEAIPFIILGSFISAIIQIFISDEFIVKLIPKVNIWGYLGSALIGLMFPVCECAIIPITRSLIKKGIPVGLGVTFMLSVPIINPIVIMSTYYAFYDKQAMVILRIAGGFVSAILIGIIVNALEEKKECIILNNIKNDYYCNCGCNNSFVNENKFKAIFEHTNREFLDIMGYLIFGAFISSTFQVISSQGEFNFIFSNKIFIIIFMMILGFALSLCSEADAFVGRSFLENYSFSGVAAFLILGPMLDLKNLVMLFGTFKKSFVFKLVISTISVVFIICCLFATCGI
ncbi:putative two-component membrane permease complex subunit [Clostridium puniceum]|uniref:Putative two-component membrane permease complex subunit n=1 Tax=Clostridium puniceum TaxID=29367 RepID=A0A1S8TWM0_9CLOT|nr:permease [Clostridium puniceum]OOM82157.1 putative two-component membrane permease complex subunit [Clostridium puniceum]